MVLFLKNHQFTFDFTSKYIPYKRKQEIRRKIVDNGGTISYILNNKTKFFVSENADIGSTYKGIAALKLGIPIVSLAFVDDCAEKQKLLDSDDYLLLGNSSAKQFSSGFIKASASIMKENKARLSKGRTPLTLTSTRVYTCEKKDDEDEMPSFPSNYEIIKHSWYKFPRYSNSKLKLRYQGEWEPGTFLLHKFDKKGICHFESVELHIGVMAKDCSDDNTETHYRIFTHTGILEKNGIKDSKKECRFVMEAESAVQLYSLVCSKLTQFRQSFTAFPPWIGSDTMVLTTLESQSFDNEQGISPSVRSLVHTLWAETVGELTSLLAVPAERIKMEDIVKAEAALLTLRGLIKDKQSSVDERQKLSDEFYSLIPHVQKEVKNIDTKWIVAEKQDLCQLIKDMVNINEATSFSTQRSDAAKYRALRCHIEDISECSMEYKNVLNKIRSSEYSDTSITVHNIFSCNRPIESSNFCNLDNSRRLFHSSKAQNFLGILSRGLLLPKMVVEDYGGERTDIGHLGTGIYFASDSGASVKYSSPGHVRGSRFMLICDVALGNIQDYTNFHYELNDAPEGFDSCHGVRRHGDGVWSDFEDDEYVIYAVNQQMIRYLVEFTLADDNVESLQKELLSITLIEENILVEPMTVPSLDDQNGWDDIDEDESVAIDITDVENMVDPLTKVKAGLQYDGDSMVPLQSVHIRAKLLDLCAKVVVMQVYENPSCKPIEAKYVFPLDDMAAVCGFEAFINGKHIIGEVKEKEEAHREYKKAISEGHGAYLMDEETPDVFSVSVGNIPVGATVIIKISYVAELAVEGDNIKFHLPGSLAPWKRDQALQDETQDVLATVHVETAEEFDLTVHVAIEMPFDIRTLECPTHKVKMKKTAAKAVVEMDPGQTLDDGFQLLVGLAEIHVPRMWVEKHSEHAQSQACMLSFYPEFEAEPMNNIEIIFLLDLSCSMQGVPLENAKKILSLALHHLPENAKFNIISFGGHWIELFPTSVSASEKTLKEAGDFINVCRANMGASDFWRILKALSVLPVSDDVDVRNIFIVSDGDLCEEEPTLRMISSKQEKSRIFSFGVGPSANRYFLRTLSRVGAGASEYFDPKLKSKWKRKVQSQLLKCQQPVLTSVSVAWQQFDDDAPKPIQAPTQILSLFNGCRQVVYGFVPFCTQATLHAKVNGKEISTMVSTSELSMTKGKTLHQMTARALINDWEDGSLAEDHILHQAVKRDRKKEIIEISKKHSVTSKFTSFVAIERRDEDESIDEDTLPDIQEIIDDEDVDILPYIGWEKEKDGADVELLRESMDVIVTSIGEEVESEDADYTSSSSSDDDSEEGQEAVRESEESESSSSSEWLDADEGMMEPQEQEMEKQYDDIIAFSRHKGAYLKDFDDEEIYEDMSFVKPSFKMSGGGAGLREEEQHDDAAPPMFFNYKETRDAELKDVDEELYGNMSGPDFDVIDELGEVEPLPLAEDSHEYVEMGIESRPRRLPLIRRSKGKPSPGYSLEADASLEDSPSMVPPAAVPFSSGRPGGGELVEKVPQIAGTAVARLRSTAQKRMDEEEPVPSVVGGDGLFDLRMVKKKKKKAFGSPGVGMVEKEPESPGDGASFGFASFGLPAKSTSAAGLFGTETHVSDAVFGSAPGVGMVEKEEERLAGGGGGPFGFASSRPQQWLSHGMETSGTGLFGTKTHASGGLFGSGPGVGVVEKEREPLRGGGPFGFAFSGPHKFTTGTGLFETETRVTGGLFGSSPGVGMVEKEPEPLRGGGPFRFSSPQSPTYAPTSPLSFRAAPIRSFEVVSLQDSVAKPPPPPPSAPNAPELPLDLPWPCPFSSPPSSGIIAPVATHPQPPPPPLSETVVPPVPQPQSARIGRAYHAFSSPPSSEIITLVPPPPPPPPPPSSETVAPRLPPRPPARRGACASSSRTTSAKSAQVPRALLPPSSTVAFSPPPPPPPPLATIASVPPPPPPPSSATVAPVSRPKRTRSTGHRPMEEMMMMRIRGTGRLSPPSVPIADSAAPSLAPRLRTTIHQPARSSYEPTEGAIEELRQHISQVKLKSNVVPPAIVPQEKPGLDESLETYDDLEEIQLAYEVVPLDRKPLEPKKRRVLSSGLNWAVHGIDSHATEGESRSEYGEYPSNRSASTSLQPQSREALTDKVSPETTEVIAKLFALQNKDGSWIIPSNELNKYLKVDTFEIWDILKSAGVKSLSRSTVDTICRLLATVLVLAFLRNAFPHLFPISLLPPFKPSENLEETGTSWHAETKRAFGWLKTADKLVPCICNRLQLGINWEDVALKFLKLSPEKTESR